ncbi:CopG family transcriptional regulator [Leptolyngbya sp. AN03gr2]|uniref:ribbon-helix-helix domain-containing protein n=1 Tax=unclassified Leptolyngbya TaxID=2650499 RepID=UPI003D318DDE
MTLRKARNTQGGRPIRYESPKKIMTVSLTPSAVKGLDQLARTKGLSRSELIEQVGRGSITLANSMPDDIEFVDFSHCELEQLKDFLVSQRAVLEDEIKQRGLFQEQILVEARAEVIQYLIESIDKLLLKLV